MTLAEFLHLRIYIEDDGCELNIQASASIFLSQQWRGDVFRKAICQQVHKGGVKGGADGAQSSISLAF